MNDIGWAVLQMRDGKHVRRAGWNGKGMYIYLETRYLGLSHVVDSHVVMFTAQKTFQPGWLCSQADLLAVDWEIA